jgi:hypothetical protein
MTNRHERMDKTHQNASSTASLAMFLHPRLRHAFVYLSCIAGDEIYCAVSAVSRALFFNKQKMYMYLNIGSDIYEPRNMNICNFHELGVDKTLSCH